MFRPRLLPTGGDVRWRTILLATVAAILLALACEQAKADSLYDLAGLERYRTRGHSGRWDATTQFSLLDDGTFNLDGLWQGDWTQPKRRYALEVDAANQAAAIESMLAGEDFDFDIVSIKKFKAKTSIAHSGRMTTSVKTTAYINIPEEDLWNVKITLSGRYRGYEGLGQPIIIDPPGGGDPGTQVPEPMSLGLLAVGGLGLLGLRRRRG